MKLISNEVYKDLLHFERIGQKAGECSRWFSEFSFLEPMWEYILRNRGFGDISDFREKARSLYDQFLNGRVFMDVGKNIKDVREFLGWTQDKLAEAAKLTPAAISQIESNKRTPSLESLVSIAKSLQCTLDRLVYGLPND